MKKTLLLIAILISAFSIAQPTPTGTTSAGKFKSYTPTTGTTPVKCVIWNSTTKELEVIDCSEISGGGSGSQGLESVLTVGNNANGQEIILSDIGGDVQKISATSGEIEIYSDAYRVLISADGGLHVDHGIESDDFRVLNTVDNSKYSQIDGSLLTAARNVQMPDKSGTVAMLSDITGGSTNLSYTASPTDGKVNSDTGTDATLPLADGTNAGLLKPAKYTVLENTSGTNTGDQTSVTGNAGTATALQTARTIGTITGDATSAGSSFDGSANNTNVLTLATVNSNVGSFGTASNVAQITANGKGLITAAANVPIQITESQVTNLTTDLIKKQLREGKIEFAGKNINFEMDSYGTGSIVTFPTTQKWNTLVAGGVAGNEVTRAFSGSTVQKRSPINWAGGTATNLIDEVANIPIYDPTTTSILVIALGTNDAGQTGSNYTTANYNADYSSALTIITTPTGSGGRNYPADRILLVSPYYVNSTGYTSYAALTGNAAPTLARFEAFVAETKTVAETFGTMYLDVFHDEQTNNTTSTAISTDGIHKTTYGHAYLAHDTLGYLGQTSLLYGVKTNSTISNPTCINLGGTNSSANTPSAGKIILYDNGNNGIYSLGISADFDFYKAASSKFNWWDNTTRIASMNNSGFGFGVVPSAKFHAAAGTASAGTASFKGTAGTLMSTPEALADEYNASSKYSTTVALNRYANGGKIYGTTTDVSNTSTTETDILTYTTKASTLAATGESLVLDMAGTFNDITATADLKFYFAGTSIGDTGALTVSATGGWTARIVIVRSGSTTAKAMLTVTTPSASTAQYTTVTALTGLTFTGTNILKCTGTAGGAGGGTGDITASLGQLLWWGASNN